MTTYSAVVTTGIYCRPGCGAKPLAKNVIAGVWTDVTKYRTWMRLPSDRVWPRVSRVSET